MVLSKYISQMSNQPLIPLAEFVHRMFLIIFSGRNKRGLQL